MLNQIAKKAMISPTTAPSAANQKGYYGNPSTPNVETMIAANLS
ncbi:MAG: hypothetical protein VX741_04070 [Pseudomonadota bacterium]|nr:hypothetical protein [Pseudomonadota bacterium]